MESRPYSKTKRWKVAEILSSIEIAEVQPEEIEVDEDILSAAATSAALAEAVGAAVADESSEEPEGDEA